MNTYDSTKESTTNTPYTTHSQHIPHTPDCSDGCAIGEVHEHQVPSKRHGTMPSTNNGGTGHHQPAGGCVDNLVNMSPSHSTSVVSLNTTNSRSTVGTDLNRMRTGATTSPELSPIEAASRTSPLMPQTVMSPDASPMKSQGRMNPSLSRHGMSGDLGSPTPVLSQTYIAPGGSRRRSDPDEIYSESYC